MPEASGNREPGVRSWGSGAGGFCPKLPGVRNREAGSEGGDWEPGVRSRGLLLEASGDQEPGVRNRGLLRISPYYLV